MKAFIDLETDGLADDCRVLEFALVVTDDQFGVLYETSLLVDPGVPLETVAAEAHPRVQEMHEANGLWDDLEAAIMAGSAVPLEDFEVAVNLVFDEAEEIVGQSLRNAPIAGFNPFFDRRKLEVRAPSAIRRLHYRSFDCSTLRALVQDRRSPLRGDVPHRALGDCHSAIQFAQWFLTDCLTPA